MLSDLSLSVLSFDTPVLPDTCAFQLEEDPPAPLNFDDLLDIASEFEFAQTITHIWPYDEDPGICTEMRLDDLLAAIVPAASAERSERPAPLPTANPVRALEADSRNSDLLDPASDSNISVPADPAPFLDGDNQRRVAETDLPIGSILQGWTPPNGCHFLELDDSLLSPRSTMFLSASPVLPIGNTDQPFTTDAVGLESPTSTTVLKPPPVNPIETIDDSRKKKPTPMQPSTDAAPKPAQALSTTRANSNALSDIAPSLNVRTPKSRLPSAPGVTTANYAKAPRGGIPPHIARSVTKANILRVEKERKVIQDAFATVTARETKKPSVLRKTIKVERERSESTNGSGSGKKPINRKEGDDKGHRSAKRVRV